MLKKLALQNDTMNLPSIPQWRSKIVIISIASFILPSVGPGRKPSNRKLVWRAVIMRTLHVDQAS